MTTVTMPPYLTQFYETHYPGGLFYANETFYAYRAGAWEQVEERAHVRHRLARFFAEKASAEKIGGALSLLKDFLAVADTNLNPSKHLICLRNGTLDTIRYQLLPHSPEYMLTNRTDIEWKPDATCERWLQFLDEVFAFDRDKAQKIAFVQEWFGYCLIPDVSQHKFVWMVGAGGNGKSVLLSVLTKLVGESNVSHAYLERLGEKVVRAELEGKLLNVSSEMSADATVSDGYYKAIVAGDIIEAERKFKPSFSFRPTVRLIASTNNLPRLLDLSDGFSRRAVILSFNRKFADHEKDVGLEAKLHAELSGIMVWAVEGLRRLRERGTFVVPESSFAALQQYRQESDPVALFTDECLQITTNMGMAPGVLYQQYSGWCRENGYKALQSMNFGKRLAAQGIGKRRSGGKDYWLVASTVVDPLLGEAVRVMDDTQLLVSAGDASENCNQSPRYQL